jgi:hypothetical protein
MVKISPPVGYTHIGVKRSEKRRFRKGMRTDNCLAASRPSATKEALFITIEEKPGSPT